MGNGERVPKTDLRIAAYGAVDELNSLLGVCLASELPESFGPLLTAIQNDLFDVGADLCVPEVSSEESTPDENPPAPLRVHADQVAGLENWIDHFNESLEPLTSFVLPGGSVAAAHLHLARAVCRRVELQVYHLLSRDEVNPQIAVYLNRLSDLLFVLARVSNNNGQCDVLWVPGANRTPPNS